MNIEKYTSKISISAVFFLEIILDIFIAAVLTAGFFLHSRSLALFACMTFFFIKVVEIIYIKRVMNKQKKAIKECIKTEAVEDLLLNIMPMNRREKQGLEKILLAQKERNQELAEISRNEAKYLALQNQINPHFLYNSLETIRSEAYFGYTENVMKMTEALATYFRYTISSSKAFVTVENEINNINNYFLIQHFRFGDKLSMNIQLEDEEALALYMPKLILQPIIENAIFHGLEKKIGPGKIIVNFTVTEERLLILISDNGVGMSQETLDLLNRKFDNTDIENESNYSNKKGNGIAIANVNNRIRLLFGRKYGLHYHSVLDLGTDVYITLPVITSKNVGKYTL